MTSLRETNPVEFFYTANPSVSDTAYSKDRLSPIIELGGKSYHLTVYHKKPNQSEWEEITNSYLKLANKVDLQEILQKQIKVDLQEILQKQIKVPCKNIEITTSIYPNTNSVCNIQDTNGRIRKIAGFSLTAPQNAKIFEILEKIKNPESIHQSKKILSDPRSSSIKISLKETKKARVDNYLEQTAVYTEEVIGLDRQGNNCCINAALQIILNNPSLRKIWGECFKETADIYYEALNEGKSSAPKTVGYEFRKQLVKNSHFNLIDKNLFSQEDPTAFLEVFFNTCKEKLDLSPMEIHFEKMKYKQIAEGEEEPTIEKAENHKEFRISINNQLNQKMSLEELLRSHCLEINEIEENGVKVKYIAKDQYTSLPNHLIIDLFAKEKRDSSKILIPTDLTIPEDLFKDEHSIHQYELEGFVVHLGKTHESGHYTAYRKVNGQWKKFDDSTVTDVDENQLQQLLGNFQEEKPKGLFKRFLKSTRQAILEGSKPYACMLSYSKKSCL